MKVDKSDNRPAIRTLLVSLTLVAVIVVIGVVFNQSALAALPSPLEGRGSQMIRLRA